MNILDIPQSGKRGLNVSQAGQFGQDQVDAAPAQPQLPELAPQNLIITNTAGAIALKLTCPTNPGENTIIPA